MKVFDSISFHLGDQAVAEKYNTDNENTKDTKQKYYYFSILKGNYPENVKNAILLRKNWKEVFKYFIIL